MKYRKAFAFLIAILTMIYIVALPGQKALACIQLANGPPGQMKTFPASLRIVEDDAFSGTSFKTIIFDSSLVFIGNGAFQDVCTLTDVYIPESTAFIGSEAFPSDTIIHGSAGSYAQKWAEENSHRFQSDNVWNNTSAPLLSLLLLAQAWLFVPAVDTQHEYRFRRVTAYLRDMRPQERRELYPINYRFP